MNFLLDENIDEEIASFLKEHGHDATSMHFDYHHGISDPEVLALAYREQRVLITDDGDFGELIFRQALSHAGIILFRLKEQQGNLELRKELLFNVLSEYTGQLRDFIVVTPIDMLFQIVPPLLRIFFRSFDNIS